MPLTIKRTNITSIAANSVLFNGSSQYLTATRTGGWLKSANNFTMECWVYFTRHPSSYGGFNASCVAGTSDSSNGWELNFGGNVSATTSLNFSIKNITGISATRAFNTNTWYHIAVVRSGTTITLYIDGTSARTATVSSWTDTAQLRVGALNLSPYFYYFPGYISNFRIVDGTAVYTSNFTPPTATLTAIANTSLLTCNAPTIVDSSSNNFTITNNGSATVSSINPFRAPINNFQFARRASTVSGKSVQFDGTNDYLSVNRILDNSTDVTIEAWVRATSTPPSNSGYIVSQYVASAADRTIFAVGPDLKIFIQIGSTSVSSAAAITLNTWYHLAFVRSGSGANNFSIYINGVRDGQMTYTGTFQNTPTTIGGTNNLASTYFPGYISNLRILKGTALYTGASFSVPTAPLTAIANTALLTCNADTIVDSSTNNFTITNNNGATVSSVSPFVASSGGMSLKKVFADPIVVYLTQKAIFGYGSTGTVTAVTNLVSNTGVVASDTTGVGTARYMLAAAGYGTDKSIFGYGYTSTGVNVSLTNLVSNTGVVVTDTAGVGTGRYSLAAAGYGSDKAIFGYGFIYSVGNASMTNLVSNTGVVATNTAGVGTARNHLAAAGYGSDKAVFGYGNNYSSTYYSLTNLVSNTGVVATDTAGVGTARNDLAAAGYSLT